MPRGLSQAKKTAIEANTILKGDLFEFHFGQSTSKWLTTYRSNIIISTDTSGGIRTYMANGDLISHDAIKESSKLKEQPFRVQITGVNTQFLELFTSEQFFNRPFYMYRQFVNPTTYQFIETPDFKIGGTMVDYNYETDGDNIKLIVIIGSPFNDLKKVRGRRTNDASQQKHFPGDRGMEFAGASSDLNDDIVSER